MMLDNCLLSHCLGNVKCHCELFIMSMINGETRLILFFYFLIRELNLIVQSQVSFLQPFSQCLRIGVYPKMLILCWCVTSDKWYLSHFIHKPNLLMRASPHISILASTRTQQKQSCLAMVPFTIPLCHVYCQQVFYFPFPGASPLAVL